MYTMANENVKDAIDRAFEKAEDLPEGSEERAREFKNIKVMLDYIWEQYRYGEESLDDRERLAAELKLKEAELRLKEAEIRNEQKKYRLKPDTIVNVLAVVGMGIFGAGMEVAGWRIPRQLDQVKRIIFRN